MMSVCFLCVFYLRSLFLDRSKQSNKDDTLYRNDFLPCKILIDKTDNPRLFRIA